MQATQAYEEAKKQLCVQRNWTDIKELFQNELEKFFSYIAKQKTSVSIYKDYLTACQALHLDMSLPKNRYPHDFRRWHDIRIDEYKTLKAQQDAEKRKELYAQYPSPNADYTANVIVYDHGMLGGKTEVALKDELDKFSFLMFRFEKKELVLYSGKYSEHTSIEIEWIDDEYISIKGVIYSTNGEVLKDKTTVDQ